jgi:SAM-dependent methyltransferase
VAPRPLGEDYFARYGSNTPGERKTDYSRSWRHFTFSLPEILRAYRSGLGGRPATFLDIGAADGSLVKQALERGLDARGLENSPYILARIADPALRARIAEADAADAIRGFARGSFDVIVECAAQYLPPRRLDRYLREVARASSGMVCLSADYRGHEGNRSGPHLGVRTFETKTWWRRKLREAGFARCEGDYYFFKE